VVAAVTAPAGTATLPVAEQAERLIALGVPERAGLTADEFRAAARALPDGDTGPAVLALHPDVAPASRLAPLLRRHGKPGFVVVDMTDVDSFTPIDGLPVPDGPVYLARRPERGDELANVSPDEALPAIAGAGRSPLLLTEGIAWLLQHPEVLERGRCFMTIGSRLRRPDGRLDARTPAIWISGGTGRDGTANRGAPKVGWCWAGNRHSWLGFASCADRIGAPAVRA
jgi:hypothetical protein